MSAAPVTRRAFTATFAAAAALVGVGALPAAAESSVGTGSRADRLDSDQLAYETWASVRLQKALWQYGDTSLVNQYVSPALIQHNPLTADGPAALAAIAVAVHKQFPQETFTTVRAFAEDDLVILHTHSVLAPGIPARAVVDIMRFQNRLIVEHWDVVQNVPATSVSGNDMFATLSSPCAVEPGPRWLTAGNKALVTGYVSRLANQDLSAVDEYVAPGLIQHDPSLANGAQATKASFAAYYQKFPNSSYEVKRVIAEGDLVAVHAHLIAAPGDLGESVAEIFRVHGGKIVEHWDVFQAVPAMSANNNTMF